MSRLILIVSLLGFLVTAFAGRKPEDQMADQALDLIRKARGNDPVSDPDFRRIYFELLRLQQLPDTDNPKLLSLDKSLVKPPPSALGIPWPPHLKELQNILKEALAKPGSLDHAWLDRVHLLLRVENEMQRLPPEKNFQKQISDLTLEMFIHPEKAVKNAALIAELQKKMEKMREQLIRQLATEDVNDLLALGTIGGHRGNLDQSIFAKSRVRLPKEISPELKAILPADRLTTDELTGVTSLSMLQARELLKKPMPPALSLELARIVSQNVRNHLPNEIQTQRNAGSLLRDLQHRQAILEKAPPPVKGQPNRFSVIPGGNPADFVPRLSPFLKLSSKEEARQEANACFRDEKNPVNRLGASEKVQDREVQRLRSQGTPDSFPIELYTESGEKNGRVGNCMMSIVDPEAIGTASGKFPEAPDHEGPNHVPFRRVIAFTAKHCVANPDDLKGINLLGFAEVPKSNLKIHPMPDGDFAMISMDVPEREAIPLWSQKSRFVTPPSRDLDVTNLGVVADPNLGAGRNKSRNVGSTFAVPGDDGTQVGLNFNHLGNQGIFPGDSGGGIFTTIKDKKTGRDKKLWLGAMSYKCVDASFQDSIGAMASGKRVFDFINDNLANAVAQTIKPTSTYLAHRGSRHEDPPGPFHYDPKPVHAGDEGI